MGLTRFFICICCAVWSFLSRYDILQLYCYCDWN
nr:MAG TPA: hypothetical protein [Caudoviricetes sp.]